LLVPADLFPFNFIPYYHGVATTGSSLYDLYDLKYYLVLPYSNKFLSYYTKKFNLIKPESKNPVMIDQFL